MTLWITVITSAILCVALVANKRYSRLYYVIAYFTGTAIISILYNIFFKNWYFYLYANNIAGSILFALAYWSVAKQLEDKNLIHILVAAACVPFIPLLGIPFLTKIYLPYFIVDVAIAFSLPFALRVKNPFLIIWGIAAFWGLSFDAIKMYAPEGEILTILRNIDYWNNHVARICLIGVILWKPVLKWVLTRLPVFQSTGPSLVKEAAGSDIRKHSFKDAESAAIADLHNLVPREKLISANDSFDEKFDEEMEALNPVLKTAAMMLTLNHKPYLTQEEAMFYLDLSEDELDAFLDKYGIAKINLTSKDANWVVRREDVENIEE